MGWNSYRLNNTVLFSSNITFWQADSIILSEYKQERFVTRQEVQQKVASGKLFYNTPFSWEITLSVSWVFSSYEAGIYNITTLLLILIILFSTDTAGTKRSEQRILRYIHKLYQKHNTHIIWLYCNSTALKGHLSQCHVKDTIWNWWLFHSLNFISHFLSIILYPVIFILQRISIFIF